MKAASILEGPKKPLVALCLSVLINAKELAPSLLPQDVATGGE